jgi:hypothetical protein
VNIGEAAGQRFITAISTLSPGGMSGFPSWFSSHSLPRSLLL